MLNALELRLFCIKPSMWRHSNWFPSLPGTAHHHLRFCRYRHSLLDGCHSKCGAQTRLHHAYYHGNHGGRVRQHHSQHLPKRRKYMMTSSNGNSFRVTGPLWGEFTGHRWITLTKASDAELWCFALICAWINSCANNRDADGFRRHRAHYDVIVVAFMEEDDIKSSELLLNFNASLANLGLTYFKRGHMSCTTNILSCTHRCLGHT